MNAPGDNFWQQAISAFADNRLAAFACDLQATVQWATPPFQQIANPRQHEFSPWSLVRILAPEELPSALHDIRRSASGERHVFSVQCVSATGERFRLLMLTFPARTPDGRAGFAGLAFELQPSLTTVAGDENLFQRAMQRLPTPAAISDSDGHLLWANAAYYALYSCSFRDLGQRLPHLENGHTAFVGTNAGASTAAVTDVSGRTVTVTPIVEKPLDFWLHMIAGDSG